MSTNIQVSVQNIEEQSLIQSAQEGNGEAVSILLEKYKGTVRALSRPLFLMDGDQDDLIQEGMIGLFKAIQSYDGGKGTTFETFANMCISRQLYNAIEKSNRKKNLPLNSYISIYSPEYFNDENNRTENIVPDKVLADWQKNPEEIIIHKESTRTALNDLYRILSKFEKKVFYFFLKGLTYQEIAKRLDASPKKIDNALQRIKMKYNQKKEK